jgi:hypothetical protein
MATPTAALQLLKADPETFLKNHYLLSVRTMFTSGVTEYWFGGVGQVMGDGNVVYTRTPRPGSILGSLHMHDSKNFKFSPYRFELVGDPIKTMAWHVDVTESHTTNLAQIPPLAVSRHGGPDLVVTTLLNGCCFVCEPAVNAVFMAHLRPTGGTHADQLENTVINTGAFNGGGGVGAKVAFGGARSYNVTDHDVTIVGLRDSGRWRMFAQIHPRNQRATLAVVEFFNG